MMSALRGESDNSEGGCKDVVLWSNSKCSKRGGGPKLENFVDVIPAWPLAYVLTSS